MKIYLFKGDHIFLYIYLRSWIRDNQERDVSARILFNFMSIIMAKIEVGTYIYKKIHS